MKPKLTLIQGGGQPLSSAERDEREMDSINEKIDKLFDLSMSLYEKSRETVSKKSWRPSSKKSWRP